MSDLEPTRAQPAADETMVMPATQVDDVGGPGGPDDPGGYYAEPGPDRRWWWILGGIGALLLLLLIVLLMNPDDDDEELAAVSSTTTSSSTTSSSTTSTTVRATTTTAAERATTTTAAATKTTIAASRCTGKTDPTRPETPVRTLHDAWRVGDRSCAVKVATNSVVDELFDLDPKGPEWDFQGCEEQTDPEPHEDCAYTYEGGSVHFRVRYGATNGWQVYDMYAVAD